ncbi:MAG TPA: sulfotransferase domain-containing protein [Gaiellaceae bacterium]|nr:sulfotransferase domain-containing protein [Gaiellaceae bacterium]
MPAAIHYARDRLRPWRRRVRFATRRARILPGFLLIGAQRAGTTTLFDYLLRHPELVGPLGGDAVAWSRKEIHFFDERFARGTDWYRAFFPLESRRRAARRLGRELVAGESTPYYMFHPAVPERVAGTIPDVRLIALLRDPVARAYSHYQMMCRMGREKLSFEEALAAEEERLAGAEEQLAAGEEALTRRGHRGHHHHRHRAYFARGLYADQLERWLASFPREQLLVLRAEDFFARPAEVYAETLAFLHVRPRPLGTLKKRATTANPGRPWSHREQRNRASYGAMAPAVRAELEERYAEPNARLERLLGRDFGWGSATSTTEPGDPRHLRSDDVTAA